MSFDIKFDVCGVRGLMILVIRLKYLFAVPLIQVDPRKIL